jgi:hypothetical protein
VSIWNFTHSNGRRKETLTVQPFLEMNDYAGLATALLAGTGIGDLPPLVQPELLRDGRLVEVMPQWRSIGFHLWVVHLGSPCLTRPVRVFKEFAAQMASTLFPLVSEISEYAKRHESKSLSTKRFVAKKVLEFRDDPAIGMFVTGLRFECYVLAGSALELHW